MVKPPGEEHAPSQSLDLLVKERLKQWPQRPPGVKAAALGRMPGFAAARRDDVRYHLS